MNQNAKDSAAAHRARLKHLRRDMNPAERDRGALLMRGRLFTWLATQRTQWREQGASGPLTIAAFWPLPMEPDLVPLLRQWAGDPALTLTLPAIVAPGQPLAFHHWTPDTPLETGPHGVQQPVATPAATPDIILVPTLGFTRDGDRLGYGGGYYDRTLSDLKARGHPVTSVGIAWAGGDLSASSYQPGAHDVRLDSILTDKGWARPASDVPAPGSSRSR